jgi:hypothetical protein
MNIKHYLQPWILITIGILMNIVSAIVTHYFISQNNAELNIIEQRITAIESNIESQWQTKNEIERKKEFIFLLLNNQESHEINLEITDYLNHYLSSLKRLYLYEETDLNLSGNIIDIDSTIQITKLAQEKVINDINDQYFEKLELESTQQPFKDNNAILYSIAIFMQLIGLILVLSRDLARQ